MKARAACWNDCIFPLLRSCSLIYTGGDLSKVVRDWKEARNKGRPLVAPWSDDENVSQLSSPARSHTKAVLAVLRQVSCALKILHARLIMHRDVKVSRLGATCRTSLFVRILLAVAARQHFLAKQRRHQARRFWRIAHSVPSD